MRKYLINRVGNESLLIFYHRAFCFTLIELLLVVSIIAILTSMLLPALNKARGTARRTECKNQERTLLLGAVNYSSDFDGFIAGDTATYKGSNGWLNKNLDIYSSQDLQYVKPMHFFYGGTYCPSVFRLWGKDLGNAPLADLQRGTYKLPQCVGGIQHYNSPYDGTTSEGFIKYTRLPNLSKHFYFGEGSNGAGGYSIRTAAQNTVWGGTGIDYAHDKMVNFMYLDGHSDSLRIKQLPAFPTFNGTSTVTYPW